MGGHFKIDPMIKFPYIFSYYRLLDNTIGGLIIIRSKGDKTAGYWTTFTSANNRQYVSVISSCFLIEILGTLMNV